MFLHLCKFCNRSQAVSVSTLSFHQKYFCWQVEIIVFLRESLGLVAISLWYELDVDEVTRINKWISGLLPSGNKGTRDCWSLLMYPGIEPTACHFRIHLEKGKSGFWLLRFLFSTKHLSWNSSCGLLKHRPKTPPFSRRQFWAKRGLYCEDQADLTQFLHSNGCPESISALKFGVAWFTIHLNGKKRSLRLQFTRIACGISENRHGTLLVHEIVGTWNVEM